MEKHFPVTKVQGMVLGALGLEAAHFDEAKELLAHLGLTVNVVRQGRTTVPSIRVEDRVGGGWNGGGDADTWQQSPYMDLTPLMQWIVNPEYADRVTVKYRQMQDEQKRLVEQDSDDGEMRVTVLSDSTPDHGTSAMASWSGYTDGTEMASWRGEDGTWCYQVRGFHEGNYFESDDFCTYDSRAEAEEAGRSHYAQSQEPVGAYD